MNPMIKHVLLLFLLLTGIASFGQTTIQGYYTYYESQDSSAIMNQHFSTEIFDSTGGRIYDKLYPLTNPNGEYLINYYIGSTKNLIHESIIGLDTARTYIIQDTLHTISYIIEGSDTSFKYHLTFDNGLIVEKNCLVGCKEKIIIGYNQHGDKDTVLTIWDKGDTTYSIYIYDEKNRIILYKDYLDELSDTAYLCIESKYDDVHLIRTDTYGGANVINDKQIIITYYNPEKIPIKKEIIEIQDGKKERWIIDYTIE